MAVRVLQPELRAHSGEIVSGTVEDDAQGFCRGLVQVQFGRIIVLGDEQIGPAVVVKIGRDSGALLARDFDSSEAAVEGYKSAVPFAAQKKAAAVVVAGKVSKDTVKILAQKQVFD